MHEPRFPHDREIERFEKLEQLILEQHAAEEKRRRDSEERERWRVQTKRDYVAICIAVIAALFTGWMGWEAHRTRLASAEIGRRAIETQQEQVKEQVAGMQLDERPFVTVSPDDLVIERLGNQTSVYINYKVSAAGKTPAFGVQLDISCGIFALPDDLNTLDRVQQLKPLMFNESQGFSCLQTWRTRKPAGMSAVLFGKLAYDDYFKVRHHSVFCFQVDDISGESDNKNDVFYTCDEIQPSAD